MLVLKEVEEKHPKHYCHARIENVTDIQLTNRDNRLCY